MALLSVLNINASLLNYSINHTDPKLSKGIIYT